MPINRIVVGSPSAVKERAVKAAVERLVLATPPQIHLRHVRTKVAAQPIGLEQTLLGAVRRATIACYEDLPAHRNSTLYLGIESGLIALPGAQAFGDGDHPWALDLAVVYLLAGDTTQAPIVTTSVGVSVPNLTARTCFRQAGTASLTVGELLSHQDPQVQSQDPHQALCGISRVDLLADAVYAALKQLKLGAQPPERTQ